MRDSFVLYRSLLKPIQGLSDEALGRLFRAIYEYQENGSTDVDSDIAIPFAYIVNQFRIDDDKYAQKCQRNRENIARRWRPDDSEDEGENDTTVYDRIRPYTNAYHNDNDNYNENENENVNENATHIVCVDNAPACACEEDTHYEDFLEIFFQRNAMRPEMETERFLSFYRSTDWHVKGGERMNTWKQRYARANYWSLSDKHPRFSEPFFSVWKDVVAALPPELRPQAMGEAVKLEMNFGDIILSIPPELDNYFRTKEAQERIGAIVHDGRLTQSVKFKPCRPKKEKKKTK